MTGLDAAWRDALLVWDVRAELDLPRLHDGTGEPGEPIAYIDLRTREVVVNVARLERLGASASLTAVLAHEIGHHVRWPHTMGLVARLEVLERRLVPGLGSSLTNVFFDLLVNEVVGRTRSGELCAVYRGCSAEGDVPPIWAFYYACYEELWGRPAGFLAPRLDLDAMEAEFPGWRIEARVFVQTFYALPDVQLQFIYFLSRFIRYLPDPARVPAAAPLAADLPPTEADDFGDEVYGSVLSDRAVDEARERGWVDAAPRPGDEVLTTIERAASGRPAHEARDFRRALVDRYYSRLVDRYLLDVPVVPDGRPPEAYLPTVTEDHEPGDDPRGIDWTASVLARGALAGATPLRRELEPDLEAQRGSGFPAVELYLDTSGSMPDPSRALNAMTLAAQVLAASALRKGGIVRTIVYSSGTPRVSEWIYSEAVAREALLFYSGGGTEFPFDVLRRHAEERPGAVRVVISDADFLYNCRTAGAMPSLLDAVNRSHRFVALLHLWHPGGDVALETLAPAQMMPAFRLTVVPTLGDFARTAADLARALFGD